MLDHFLVLRHHRAVHVVRHVIRQVAEVPRLAQDVGLEVLDVRDRGVDTLRGQLIRRQLQQGRGDDVGRDEAHLPEAAERNRRRILLRYLLVQRVLGPRGIHEVQLGIDADLAIPLGVQRLRHRSIVARC